MRQDPDSHSTQRSRILALLIQACDAWVPLPEILALGIAQYNARIFELRRLGFQILNRRQRQGGQLHTFFRLVPGPVPPAHSDLTTVDPASSGRTSHNHNPGDKEEPEEGAPLSLFGDLQPEPGIPD